MPRDIRKRGKKHKKSDAIQPADTNFHETPAVVEQTLDENPEAPFGFVDPDLKAYFKNIDNQIREWATEDISPAGEGEDPNQDKRIFFAAALQEMTGNELKLSTDPDCSLILERMQYSMDDFSRRVFLDSLSGSFATLATHRFASHVCQTCFHLIPHSVTRETSGTLPAHPPHHPPHPQPHPDNLRSATQLVLDIVDELLPTLGLLIGDQYASHVLQSLLICLCPSLRHNLIGVANGTGHIRSKKSAKWKDKQGSMSSLFQDGDGDSPLEFAVPPAFLGSGRKILATARSQLDENEIRALSGSPVSSTVIQLIIRLEAQVGESALTESLMNAVLHGLASRSSSQTQDDDVSDYVTTLIRDSVGSHIVETVVVVSSDAVLQALWNVYIRDRLSKYAVHPVSNFVVARCITRLDAPSLRQCFQSMSGVWSKVVRAGRTGVLTAAVERAGALRDCQEEAVNSVLMGFECTDKEVKASQFLQSVLHFKSLNKKESDAKETPEESHPTVQGVILFKAMTSLSAPHNSLILEGIRSLDIGELLRLAQHPAGSRVLDAVLESEHVPVTSKNKLLLAFLGNYHVLADDRIGSRVADKCWAYADIYTKEKIARSILPHEQALLQSFYAKFFLRSVKLQLLRRSTEEWKLVQQKPESRKPTASTAPASTTEKTTKRGRLDEGGRLATTEQTIDSVFGSSSERKKRRVLKD